MPDISFLQFQTSSLAQICFHITMHLFSTVEIRKQSLLTADVWKTTAVFFVGVGCAQLVVSGLVAIYYNMIIAYALFYFFASLAKTLPWKHCDHDWNTNGMWFTRIDAVSACLNFQKPFIIKMPSVLSFK